MRNPDKGKISEVNRRLSHSDPKIATNMIRMGGRITLQELIDYMASLAPGTPLADFNLNFASLTWDEPSTIFEQHKYEEHVAERARLKEAWERKSLASLLEKYGDQEPKESA